MSAIFFKELKDVRLLCYVVLASTIAAMMLPTDYARVWGVFLAYFLLPMMCAFLGSRILSADLSDEQLPFILTLPMSRTQLWTAKAGAGLLLTLAVTGAGTLAMAVCMPWRSCTDSRFVEIAVITTLAYFLVYALAATLSVVFDRPLTGAFLAYSAGVLGFLVNLMVIEKHMPWTLRRHMESEVLAGLILILVCALLRGSLYVFQSADLMDRADRMKRALWVAGAIVLAFEGSLAAYAWILTCAVRGFGG